MEVIMKCFRLTLILLLIVMCQLVWAAGTFAATGFIRVIITPSAAVQDGAQWRTDNPIAFGWNGWQNSGEFERGHKPGIVNVQCKEINGWRTPSEREVTVRAGKVETLRVSYEKNVQYGSVRIDIEPKGAINAGAKWRMEGGSWRTSGATVDNLTAGTHKIEFSRIDGWTAPASQYLSVQANRLSTASGTYLLSQKYGSLQVFLGPDSIEGSGEWRLDDGTWRTSGVKLSQVSVGEHSVSFKNVAGWHSPQTLSVRIVENTLKTVSADYQQEDHGATMQIFLSPSEAVEAGAQWRLGGGDWMNSGATMSDIPAGAHAINFQNLPGWKTPESLEISVADSNPIQKTVVYVTDDTCQRSADPYEKWRDWQEGPARVVTPELRDGNASNSLSPAEIIYFSALENDINPVLLLAKLQDEQSLLTQGKTWSNAAGDFEKRLEKATGLGVYDSGATPKWFGFYPQLVGSSYQWHEYRQRGLSFREAYETYTTGAGKYEGFTASNGIYETVARQMNGVAGTAYDTQPDTYGYFNDFRDVAVEDIQWFLEGRPGDLKNRNLFAEAPVSNSVDYCGSVPPAPGTDDEWIPPSDGFDYPVFGEYNGNANWYVAWDFLDKLYRISGSLHPGEDWNLRGSNDQGAPVYAVSNGKVVKTTDGAWQGKTILIKHNLNGQFFWSQYSHIDEIYVAEGQWIRRGDEIGTIGFTTGGPHLHFEMRSKDIASNHWPVGKSANEIEALGYLDPTDERSPCWPGTGCGSYSTQEGFVDNNRPDPTDITTLMSEYINTGIIHAEQPDDSDDGRRVYNQYYIDSRASFIRILIQSLEQLAGKVIPTDNPMPFVDVNNGDWFYEDVLKAWNLGIIAYPTDQLFNPGRPINRIEALAFTTRTQEHYIGDIPVRVTSPAFADITDPDDWKYETAQKGYASGLTTGYLTEQGRFFFPARWVIRSESVAFVEKLIAQMVDGRIGDVNGDGCVDMADIQLIRGFINTSNCLDCDLDGDGGVTILDMRKALTLCEKPRCQSCR
jgi:murein DD-endopeptidase MepM/ murein hydrolase activator NlpD